MQQIIFIILLALTGFIAFRQFGRLRRNILLGRDKEITGDSGTRWKNVLLIAFGQKKMFKNFLPAVLHLFIYVAFLFTQVELIEIILDGALGIHRFFAPLLGVLYTVIINTIEVLSILALIATIIFLVRRNMLIIPRFKMSEMKGWPTLDANIILFAEIVLVTGIFTMNGADSLLQKLDPAYYPNTGKLLLSSAFGEAAFGGMNQESLAVTERVGWWLHILVVFAFLTYLPFSKHLHIIFAFPNTYYADLKPRGEMENMPEIMNEVKSMMGLSEETEAEMNDDIPEFGANDIKGLTWKNILDAYSCTECGRCTAECPANITGKKLSPRKIMMDVRDRATEIGKNLDSKSADFIKEDLRQDDIVLSIDNYDDGKSLFDYITKEEIHACTTCNACVEACPVMIDPLDIIMQLRRYEILTEAGGPADWTPMFNSVENNAAVWQMPVERDAWRNEM
jgi:heterodisulfide reductase subunit C